MKKTAALVLLACLFNSGLLSAQETAAPDAGEVRPLPDAAIHTDNTAAATSTVDPDAGEVRPLPDTATNAGNTAAATSTADPDAGEVRPLPDAATNAGNTAAEGASAENDAAETVPAEPKPPEDPLKNMLVRFSFDAGIAPDSVADGLAMAAVFQRNSPAMLNGQEIGADTPRLAAGKFGKGLLLESAHANLYSPSQASAEETSMFQSLNGSELSGAADQPWEGKQALAVTTRGEADDEGAALAIKAEKALYNGASVVPAFYTASVYLKGQGGIKLYLKDVESGIAGEPVYVTLENEWKRFACTFEYAFPAVKIGAGHEADWQSLLPPGTNIEAQLQLAIIATDGAKTTFYADGLQLEQRTVPPGQAGAAPHAWMPGGTALANETLQIETKGSGFDRWRKNGTISFWFLPNWAARDGAPDTILQVAKNLMTFKHANGKIHLAPAGAAFTPSDWQDTWHHIAITWNEEGHWVLFVDGLDYPNDETLKRPMSAAAGLVFGDASPAAAPNGMIDDLMLFQIALTTEQVQALFAGDLLKPGETHTNAE